MEEQPKEKVDSDQLEEVSAKEFIPNFRRRDEESSEEDSSLSDAPKTDVLNSKQLAYLGIFEAVGLIIFQQVALALLYKLGGLSISVSACISACIIMFYYLLRCTYLNKYLGVHHQGLNAKENFSLILKGVGLCFLVALAYDQVLKLLDYVPEPQNVEELLGGNDFNLTAAYLMLVFSAPVWEEIAFRGVLQDALHKLMKPSMAILLSGTIFGIIHFDKDQTIPLILLGCVFGWMYHKSKSVFPCIIAHSFVNTLGAVNLFSGTAEEARQALQEAFIFWF